MPHYPPLAHAHHFRFTTASESLDDLRRKLDVEHTSISSKLEQGAAARQELQDLKGTCACFLMSLLPTASRRLLLNRKNYGGSRAQQGVPCKALGQSRKQGMMQRILFFLGPFLTAPQLAAARKIHSLKQDMSTCAVQLATFQPATNPSNTCRYLVGQLSEAEGSLDGCSKTCSRQAEYVSKLTFEIEETDKKLVLEAERLQRQA